MTRRADAPPTINPRLAAEGRMFAALTRPVEPDPAESHPDPDPFDPPPPGERAEDEITGDDAVAAFGDALHLFTSRPRVHVTLKDIGVTKVRGRIALTVKYRGKKAPEFTVRLSSAWAKALKNRLAKVLKP